MKKLIVKDLDIATGGPLVVAINQDDAKVLDVHQGDRVLLRAKKKSVVIVDIAVNGKNIKRGHIGCFEEVLSKLNLKHKDEVRIDYAKKPASINIIRKKLDGGKISKKEMDIIVSDIVRDELSHGELTYFVSGCYTKGLDIDETVALTKSIVKYGDQIKVNKKKVLDKHCTGGIPGNRTTMLVIPIVAAAGYTFPKTSSRSITSPAGTADTMEVLAPVTLPVKKMENIVKKIGAFIAWGGGVNLASADDKLIKVRHPMSLDPRGMLLASILAKKKAVSSTHILIDIPVGKHTKIKSQSQAEQLKKDFIKVGKRLGMQITVIITHGEDVIGNGVGPALEAKDILYVLRRDHRRPLDLEKKALYMATRLLAICGEKNPGKKAKEMLESGKAYRKMQEIIKAQGGNPNIKPEDIELGKYNYTLKAKKTGIIKDINTNTISHSAKIAGAPLDKEAGIYMYKHEGEYVSKGDKILKLYTMSKSKLKFAKRALKQGIKIS